MVERDRTKPNEAHGESGTSGTNSLRSPPTPLKTPSLPPIPPTVAGVLILFFVHRSLVLNSLLEYIIIEYSVAYSLNSLDGS